ERHHRFKKGSPLNLVSLMDIFTILVCFLLVNTSSTPELPTRKDLAPPKSTAQNAPEDGVGVAITSHSVLLPAPEAARGQDLLTSNGEVITPLKEALDFPRGNRQLRRTEASEEEAITIMGDENISYALLHKILATCQQANYTKSAFAAHQVAKPKQ